MERLLSVRRAQALGWRPPPRSSLWKLPLGSKWSCSWLPAGATVPTADCAACQCLERASSPPNDVDDK